MSYTYTDPRPAVTTDTIVFKSGTKCIEFLLIKRKRDPFKDYWALPGGFLEIDETPDEGAKRELMEETGVSDIVLKEVGTFGDIHRDPRGRTITIAYYSFLKNNNNSQIKALSDASDVSWFSINDIPQMAFDHRSILDEAILKMKSHVILAKLNVIDFFNLNHEELKQIYHCLGLS
jgi:8-oxo-dGTP diphosphatase